MTPRQRRIGRIAGIAGACTSALTIAVFGLLTPGHDAIHGFISTLGIPGQPYAIGYAVGGSISTALHLWFLATLSIERRSTTLGASALTLLSAFFVLHLIATVVFPCANDCDWSTLSSQLHYALGFAAFVAFTIGTLLMSIDITRRGAWPARSRKVHIATGVVFATAIALLVTDLVGAYHGLTERGVAAALTAWIITLAWATWPTQSA